jgi:hypothetical protein
VVVLVVSVSLLLETVGDVGLPVEVVRVLLVAVVLVNETKDVLLDTVMLIDVLVNVPVLLVNVVELPDEDV